jgi:hypothetical protein
MERSIGFHPALTSVATTATDLFRQMAIKPFTPTRRRREFLLKERIASLPAVRNQIFKEKGAGEIPTIVIGGFVPDATEAVEFQRPLLRGFGSIYYLNFARNGFSLEMFCAQLTDLIEDLNDRGQKPVIFAISFGCGVLKAFLETTAKEPALKIKGIIMVSPVLCAADLVRGTRDKGEGVRMLESNLKRILKVDASVAEDIDRQIERARRCFQSLFEAGAENRPLNHRHLSIRKRIMEVVNKTPAIGGYQRVLALRDFSPPTGGGPIFTGPSLTLLAEREEDILVPASPTLQLLQDPDSRKLLFPRGKLRIVASRLAGDPVAHASLIFHQHCYNPLLAAWYDQIQAPRLFAAV